MRMHSYAERMEVELRQLRTLLAVVDTGTFTAAAAQLHVSQAAVSRTVAALERALGARVLHRTTRTVLLTPVGQDVVRQARRVLDDVAALVRTASEHRLDVRLGYAWAALGRHTAAVQRRWAREHPGSSLVLVQSNTPTAGLAEGLVEVAVLRRAVEDPRLDSLPLGVERRVAALPHDDPLARRRTLSLADLADRTVAVDMRTGTTEEALWPAEQGPAGIRRVSGVDEWLTVIAAGQAIGMSTEATAAQHPRPGIAYRKVRDAPGVPLSLVWWAGRRPAHLDDLLHLLREASGTSR